MVLFEAALPKSYPLALTKLAACFLSYSYNERVTSEEQETTNGKP